MLKKLDEEVILEEEVGPCRIGHPRVKTKYGKIYCSECRKIYHKKNGEKSREYNRAWLKRNKEKRKIYEREYIAKNKEKDRERKKVYLKNYYKENKDRLTAYAKKYREKLNSHKVSIRVRKHPDRDVWRKIIDRCYNPKSKDYRNYGGRREKPIKVCERWLGEEGFANFCVDMGPRPEPRFDYSINRIDNNGNYEPNNCEWATRSTQQLNTRRQRNYRLSISENAPIYYPDSKLITVKEFSEKVNMPLIVARYRYSKNRDAEWILSKDEPGRYFDFGKHRYSQIELEFICGVPSWKIAQRILRYGWSVRRAMELIE